MDVVSQQSEKWAQGEMGWSTSGWEHVKWRSVQQLGKQLKTAVLGLEEIWGYYLHLSTMEQDLSPWVQMKIRDKREKTAQHTGLGTIKQKRCAAEEWKCRPNIK